jgi:hypothetical protein
MPATRVVPVRTAVLGLAVAAAVASLPASALGVSAIPADQTGQILDGNPITAIVGDIDGDGVRELITLRPRDDDPVHLAVEVLEQDRGGQVRSAGSAPLARVASVTEQLSGLPRPDQDNLLQARVDEPARLIAWHDRGRERVLAVAIGTLRNARACCLSIWAVERGSDGIGLRLMTDSMRSADQVWAVDMDADGTDELLTTEPRQDADPNILPVAVLRWTGERFEDQTARLGILFGGGPLIPLGNSDGRPGDEMGLVRVTQTGALLHRLALGPTGRVRIDTASLPFGGSLVGIAGPEGGRLVLGDDGHRPVLLDWPAGQQVIPEARSGLLGVPVMAIGQGADARVVTVRNDRLMDVFTPRFGALRLGLHGSEAEARFRQATIPPLRQPASPPYVGPLPGGMPDGSAAFIFRGRLIRAAAPGSGDDGVSVVDVASMPGVGPIGLFGRGAHLMALAHTTAGSGVRIGFDGTREGGQLTQPAGPLRSTAIVVADETAVLAPEADDGLLRPRLEGPVRVGPEEERPFALTGGSFTVPIIGPPGTRVVLRVGEEVTEEAVPDEGVARVIVNTDAYEDGDEVPVTLLAVTPTGQGYGGEWTAAIYTRPPALIASAPFAPLSFDVDVTGRTAPDATLAVDGAQVPVAADGTFGFEVNAGIWPRDVQIEATDPLGNRSTATVSVVALLDYRQLPWIPIVALLTILAGIGLYLRVPQLRPAAPSGPITEGTLEDLE